MTAEGAAMANKTQKEMMIEAEAIVMKLKATSVTGKG